MNQMIQRIREEKKGFTLAELLVVVAIVAVLVAIAIPVFTSSLERASAQTDAANIRAGYASVIVEATDTPPTGDTQVYTLNADGSVQTGTGGDYTCKGSSDALDTGESIGGNTVTWAKGNHVTYTYTKADDSVAITCA